MASAEERVEDYFKQQLDVIGVRRYSKTERINYNITKALETASSKSGGAGRNYPDIQVMLDNGKGRQIPVMMEVKGTMGHLEKKDKNGLIASDPKSVMGYAVNGAVHYGNAILAHSNHYEEVLVIGLNGFDDGTNGVIGHTEVKAYYMAKKNGGVPIHVEALDSGLQLLAQHNVDKLNDILDNLLLSDEDREAAKRQAEIDLESNVQRIHQAIYEDDRLKNLLDVNEKLYLFCGLIIAGLPVPGGSPLDPSALKGNTTARHDGAIILDQVKDFFDAKQSEENNKDKGKTKTEMILPLITNVFNRPSLYKPVGGISLLNELYQQVQSDIIPYLTSQLHLDFAGLILNRLSDWAHIENDAYNDVVLTPRYVTTLMAKLCKTDRNSLVWDTAMGSAGFLVSAMELMIKDARDHITDQKELEEKIRHIKKEQLLGIEILGNVYLLATLNMVLMGDGCTNLVLGDSHQYREKFPATVYLLNPPYSSSGKGFNFVEEALSKMTHGYAAILIQENAGAGQGGDYTKRILQNNTLLASIHMPDKLFSGKASVQTAIYLFKVNRPHEKDDLVKFIDFSNDGYSRQNRKKSTQEVNLRNTDHATERYAEVEAIVLNKKRNTSYYTAENGTYIEDTISLNGNDWTFAQHRKIDLMPKNEDFRKTVADYLAFRVSCLMRGEGNGDEYAV